MRDMGRSIGACACCLSLLGGLGCGVVPDELWGLGHEPPGHEPPVPAPIDPRIDRDCLEQQLTPYLESIGAGWPAAFRPTGTLLVSAADQVLYSHGLGASDREQGSANGARTSFRIGSITKSFTAVAILQLAEAGLLTLDDTIGQHLPEYPAVGAGITLHQLLSHTAGLPDYTDDPAFLAMQDQPISPSELLATFWDQPLQFEPGTQFSYSNSGYAVLGAVIERVTGQTYAQHMQQAVFDPAGLARTTVGDAEGLADRALGYTSDRSGQLVPALPLDMSVPYAAGAIRSTALDLARWHSVLGTDVLLNEESRQRLTTPVLDGYAYGWVVSEYDGWPLLWHNGGINGFASQLVRVPELDLAVVVLLNADTVAPEPIGEVALRCALGEDIPPAPPPPLAELDAAQREKLLGSYGITDEGLQALQGLGFPEELIAGLASASVYEEDGALFFQPIGQGPQLMLATSAAEFVLPFVDATLEFSFADGEEAAATGVTIEQGGLVLPFER